MLRCARVAAVLAAVLMFALPAVAWAGTAPAVVGSVADAVNLSTVDAVTVSGHYAYGAAYDAGELTAVDFSNPQSPQIVSGTGAPPLQTNLIAGTNVAIAGGYAFVTSKNRNASSTSNDDGNGNSLTILDIHTDPTHPSVVGAIRDTSRLFGSYGVAVSGNYAFVAYQGLLSGQPTGPDTSKGGFSVIDISNPAGPSIVANIDNASLAGTKYAGDLYHATTVAISGHYAYVNTFYNHALVVIDISNPTAPKIVASLNDATNLTFVVDFAIQGNYLYAADQAGGSSPQLTVVDISNPLAPKVAATLTNTNLAGAYRIRVRGDFVYESASSTASIGAIDISDPLHPRLAGFVSDQLHLHSTTGLDVDPTGQYVIASSPYIKQAPFNESNPVYPPYPDSGAGAPLNTGTISVIGLDPNPIAVTINSTPPSSTTSTSASFTFSTNDDVSAAQCQLDAGPFGPCTSALPSGGASYSGLAAGSHTFTVKATDSAGNTSSQNYTWTIGMTAPSNTGLPAISGTAALGQTMTASPGSWAGNPSVSSYSYLWQRCAQSGTSCAAIPGATTPSYVLALPDLGGTVRVVVTARNGVAPDGTAASAAVGPIDGAPVNTVVPSISGRAVQGQTLSASAGSWAGYPTPATSIQWMRCDRSGGLCSAISGATRTTYVPSTPDVSHTLLVYVHGTSSAGSALARSPLTAVVQPSASGSAALSGVANGSPQLKITAQATPGSPAFNKLTVALPSGVSFVGQKRVLSHAIRVLGHGRFTVSLRNRSLVILLRHSTRSLTLIIGSRALAVTHAVRTKTRHSHVVHLKITLTIRGVTGLSARDTVQLRVS